MSLGRYYMRLRTCGTGRVSDKREQNDAREVGIGRHCLDIGDIISPRQSVEHRGRVEYTYRRRKWWGPRYRTRMTTHRRNGSLATQDAHRRERNTAQVVHTIRWVT